MNTISANGISPLRSLDKISALLNQVKNKDRKLENALRLIGQIMGAGAAAIYKKEYMDQESFTLECLGFWNDSEKKVSGFTSMPASLNSEEIPLLFWERLKEGETVFLDSPPWQNMESMPYKIFFLPLFLEDHLFGFLSFSDPAEKNLDSTSQDFMSAIKSIFELWINKMNLEKRLNDIMDFIPTPTFIMTTDELITTWNQATVEMTDWKAERMLGKDNYESSVPFYYERRPMVANLIMYPDVDWEATYPEFHRQEDKVFSLAYCPALPGGGAFLRCNTQRLYDINNRLWGAIHTVRDVTRERKMEEDLHRSESMYRAISDFAGMGIMLLRDNKVLYYNERLAKFMDISGKEVTKDDFMNWIHPFDRVEIDRHYKNLLSGSEEHLRFEFRAQNINGLRHYRAYAQLIEYEDHAAIHFILDDITEQKELARKARVNELRLYHEDRLTALGIMAAGIAHELNQPLNTIRVVTDGLLFGKDEGWDLDQEELFDNLEMVSRQVVRMSDVIQNIRNFSREDREKTVGDVNANEAIKNVFSMIGRQLEAHGISVQNDLSPDLPPIKTDLNRLEQVIMNLVVNARQALDSCSHGSKKLLIETGTYNGSVFIKVSDNATGIPDDLSVKIFDPFFTTKEVGKGTGLGLSISQSIVSEFKGRIEVSNNQNGGATFTVTAPANGG
jgi:PAS domain S-box-containing protein